MGICNNCHKKIVDQPDYYVEICKNTKTIYCGDCFKKIEQVRKIKKCKRRYRHGIIWGVIICTLLICITNLFGFSYSGSYKLEILIAVGISCGLIATTVTTIFLENMFLSKIYLGVYSFVFIESPLAFDQNIFIQRSYFAFSLAMINVFVMSIVLIITFTICTLLSPAAFSMGIHRYQCSFRAMPR